MNAGNGTGHGGRVHRQVAPLHGQLPALQRRQRGAEPLAEDQRIQRHLDLVAIVGIGHDQGAQATGRNIVLCDTSARPFFFRSAGILPALVGIALVPEYGAGLSLAHQSHRLANHQPDTADGGLLLDGLHPRRIRGEAAETGTAMHQADAGRTGRHQCQTLVDGLVAAPHHGHMLADKALGRHGLLEDLRAAPLFGPRQVQRAALVGAGTRRQHHGPGVKAQTRLGRQLEAASHAVLLPGTQRLRHLPEVQFGVQGLDLLEQIVGQLLRRDHRQARNVVDQLVGIERTALPARFRQRIDSGHAQAQESQLEDLVEAHGPHADDQHIGGICLI